jgi:hypothetical protein
VKRIFVTGVLVVLLCAATAAASVGPTVSAGRVHMWSPQFMNGAKQITAAEAVSNARAFDVIAGLEKVYRPYVSQMKAANPKLDLFLYQKGMFVYNASLAESAYSHDAQGRRITGVHYPGTYLLHPLSPKALAYEIDEAKQGLASSGFDGIFLDTLGPAALNPTFVSALPINPGTGKVWAVGDWVKATAGLAGQLAAAIGKPVIGNGLRDGRNYFDPDTATRELLRTGMAGGMAEAWLRGAKNPIDSYPRESVWQQNVDMLADAGSLGCSVLAVTKVWTTATKAQKDAWYEFALASFLLGSDGHSYLSFSYAPGDATVEYPWSNLSLGSPSGRYAKVNNVYQRSFSGGRVLVNPTTTTYTVKLGGTFHTLDGAAVTSITLEANGAEILTT